MLLGVSQENIPILDKKNLAQGNFAYSDITIFVVSETKRFLNMIVFLLHKTTFKVSWFS